jgi:methionine aminopeptidase
MQITEVRSHTPLRIVRPSLLNPPSTGFHGDLNATYPVGKIDEDTARLIATTKESMEAAIALVKPGALYREIGNKIESIVKPQGFSIVRQYVGHGINQLVSSTQLRQISCELLI